MLGTGLEDEGSGFTGFPPALVGVQEPWATGEPLRTTMQTCGPCKKGTEGGHVFDLHS